MTLNDIPTLTIFRHAYNNVQIYFKLLNGSVINVSTNKITRMNKDEPVVLINKCISCTRYNEKATRHCDNIPIEFNDEKIKTYSCCEFDNKYK